ncbi:hypothetical protein BS47DRAFT_1292497 [Hydnum rufescens UP504]|uniref:Uncharacterized protein n=1 Tax=Hydnum rufescens UP504 TaxID=1448309 RepID=A0A9P6B4U8_9AGAM|nr:hypothetical protein BS47DRAFT_1292497 [Hydnum rufescens UP504]
MLSSIGRTTINFTRKFPTPWKTSAASDGLGFVPLVDGGDDFFGIEDGKSLYLSSRSRRNQEGLGLDGDSLGIGRWTSYKWVLSFSVLSIFGMGLGGMLVSLGFWLRTWSHADVIRVIDWDILLYTTVASGCLLLTSLVGLPGTLLNSRPLLAFYNILLWPSLISTTTIGYASYKRRTYNLDGKTNEGWSRNWDDLGRLVVQNSLHCCGLYNPLHQATFSPRCYPRSPLPGCKFKLLRFQSQTLDSFTRVAFTSSGIVLLSIVVAILCSNHVTRLFGKGLMPRQYRLRYVR